MPSIVPSRTELYFEGQRIPHPQAQPQISRKQSIDFYIKLKLIALFEGYRIKNSIGPELRRISAKIDREIYTLIIVFAWLLLVNLAGVLDWETKLLTCQGVLLH
jgi:hypothetical protein